MVNLVRGPVAESRVRPFLVVAPEEVFEAPYGLPDARVVFEIDLLVLDGPPKSLDEDIVEDPAFAVHADGDAMGLQKVGKLLARELRSLVSVEDLRYTNGKSFFESLHTKGGIEGQRYLPGKHVPGVPVHDRREIDEALSHGNVSDVCAEDVVGLCDV